MGFYRWENNVSILNQKIMLHRAFMVRNQNADFHLLALSEMRETESSQYLCYSEFGVLRPKFLEADST